MDEGDARGGAEEGGAGSGEAVAERQARVADSLRSMERFRFTVTRPVGVLMVFLAVMVFGAFSIDLLPVNLMPEISYPKLTVRTEYPGAAPAEVENDVARPLEEVLGVVKGVTQISSISRAGYCDVVLEFSWDTDMNDANQDVLEKLDVVQPALPEEVKQPLILRYDPTLDPVLVLSLAGTGEQYEGVSGLKALRRVGDQQVQRLLEPVEGVAAVKIKGGLEEEIHVDLDEDALRRSGIAIDTVIQRLQAENINLAGGNMREGRTRYLIRTVNEFAGLAEIRDLVILSRDGRDVELGDIATVDYGYKDRDVITRVQGSESVEIEVYKEADANIVAMATRVRERIEGDPRKPGTGIAARLKDEFSTDLVVISDRSVFIESSINEVRDTAIFGGLLAIVVLYFFLREFKATAIVAVSIPVSIVITFAPMNVQGVSLNIMSLGGMALGVGMLVDNSIVVLESIHRCLEEGDPLLRAVLRGVAEVGSAVTSSTLTSVAVFAPMVFVEGVAGQMFGDLGLTVVFSLLASLAVALFLIPMLTALRAPDGGGEAAGFGRGFLARWSEWGSFRGLVSAFGERRMLWLAPYFLLRFVVHLALELVAKLLATLIGAVLGLAVLVLGVLGKVMAWIMRPALDGFARLLGGMERLYRRVIRWSLAHGVIVIVLSALALVVVGSGASMLDTELIPEVHQAEFTIEITLPVGTPLEETDATVRPIEEQLRERVPRLRNLVTTIGSERDSTESGERGEHTAKIVVTVLARGGMEPAAGEAAGGTKAAEVDGEGDESAAIDVSPLTAELEALVVVREIVEGIPDLEAKISRPVLFSFKPPIEVELRGYDLENLAAATEQVERAMIELEGLRDVKASIQPGNPEIQIVYDRDALARVGLDIRAVAELVRDKVQGQEATKFNRRDRKVPVRVRLADVETAGVDELRSLVVNPGGARPIPLSAVAEIEVGRGPNEIRRVGQQRVGVITANVEGTGLGRATTAVQAALAAVELPAGIDPAVTGQSEEWETSSASLYLALGLSIFLVYVIMASQFESLLHPLIILVTIPLALIGVVLALNVLGIPLSVVVFLGGIMLAGIVVNNAIVLVDYVNQLKARGHETGEALEIAGAVRLRPILMTTLTTVLGLLPMSIGIGDGAEIRQPMAITVIAGLSVSTLLTLIVIPVLYAVVDRLIGSRLGPSPAALLRAELTTVTAEQLAPEVSAAEADGVAPRAEATAPEDTKTREGSADA